MDKKLQHVMITLFSILLFVSGVLVDDVDGRKNCKRRVTTNCWPKEECEPRACAIACWTLGRFEDAECDEQVCYCLSGCRPNSNTTHRHHHSTLHTPTSVRCLA
ncbi:hypothetical protein ABFS82_11G019700 [Erythranthe guttata]